MNEQVHDSRRAAARRGVRRTVAIAAGIAIGLFLLVIFKQF